MSQSEPSAKTCGSCTLCCKLLAVEALQKPANRWCEHCVKGKGCSIYETRPRTCERFYCFWLAFDEYPDELKPDRAKVLFFSNADHEVSAVADPAYPEAVQKPMVQAAIAQIRRNGAKVVVVVGDRRTELAPTGPRRD